jgi:hypothetical protein
MGKTDSRKSKILYTYYISNFQFSTLHHDVLSSELGCLTTKQGHGSPNCTPPNLPRNQLGVAHWNAIPLAWNIVAHYRTRITDKQTSPINIPMSILKNNFGYKVKYNCPCMEKLGSVVSQCKVKN